MVTRLRFYVPSGPGDSPPRMEYPTGLLYRDNWDDYGFKTTFTLAIMMNKHLLLEIGVVKILWFHQTSGPTPMPDGLFGQLDEDYCSLGQSFDYYQRLKQLGESLYPDILVGLRDIVFDPGSAQRFLGHRGFRDSLERFGSSVRAIVDAAPLFRSASHRDSGQALSIRFQTSLGVGGNSFQLPLSFNDTPQVPGRINAIIGYNGSGKTTLLANLARVAHADLKKRAESSFLEQYGVLLEPQDLRFSSVITISYSAFDTFGVPGGHEEEREQLLQQGDVFGYVYVGLRSFRQGAEGEPGPGGDANSSQVEMADRLKSIRGIEEEFLSALSVARHPSRKKILIEAVSQLLGESSFLRLGLDADSIQRPEFMSIFSELSTGHKVVLNITVQLAAHLGFNSLVLFDEPECHLHPPLLASLIRVINTILVRYDSYGVIATHSPVVLQEIPKKYVTILRRFGSVTVLERPSNETFGESVGLLTRHVFSLDSSTTDYHSVLRDLSKEYTLAEIESLFGNELSMPARAYVENIRRATGRA